MGPGIKGKAEPQVQDQEILLLDLGFKKMGVRSERARMRLGY